jgi:hypothetical protein
MSHLQKFEALCQDDQELNAALARQIVLAKTNGMCDPSLLLNDEDGTVLNLRRLCKNTESIVKKRSWSWKKEISLDDFAQAMMNKEDGMSLNRRAKILSTFSQNHKDVSSLRSALLRNSTHKTIAIHYFKWDGSCRTAEEIQQAVMKYNDRRFLLKVIGVVVAGTVGLGAALYVRSRMSPHTAPPTNPPPKPIRPQTNPPPKPIRPQTNPPPKPPKPIRPPKVTTAVQEHPREERATKNTRYIYPDYSEYNKFVFPDCTSMSSKSCQRTLISRVNQLPHDDEVCMRTPLEIETFFLAFRYQILKRLKMNELFHYYYDQDGMIAADAQYEKVKKGEISFESVNRQFNEKTYAAGPYMQQRGQLFLYMTQDITPYITPNEVRFRIHKSWQEGLEVYEALAKKHFLQPILDWFYKYR